MTGKNPCWVQYNDQNLEIQMQEARMRVAYQGEPGAFSEEAAAGYFNSPETVPFETFDGIFVAVTSKECDYGLLPIENSLAGSIHQNYDLLLQNSLFIIGEYFLRVRHCLITFPGMEKQKIRKVISHPQALSQCAGYLRGLGVKTDPVYDTAGSVKMLKASGEYTTAAIASRRAAEIYGMQILQEGIEDNPENYTRFLAIGPSQLTPSGEAKTSIVFILKNQPGALFKALSVFALREIDLTKIESRPLAGKPWEYLFYIDFKGALNEERVKKALDHLGEYALMLRVFGSYPRASMEYL
jgi:prephenate dehydratase